MAKLVVVKILDNISAWGKIIYTVLLLEQKLGLREMCIKRKSEHDSSEMLPFPYEPGKIEENIHEY